MITKSGALEHLCSCHSVNLCLPVTCFLING